MTFDAETASFWLGDENLGKFDLAKQPVGEARYFKKITGITPMQMVQGFEIGDPDAMAAMVWILWRRKGKIVDFNAVDFAMGDITIRDADGNMPTEEEVAAAADPTQAAYAAPPSPAVTSNGDGSSTSEHSLTSSTSDQPTSKR